MEKSKPKTVIISISDHSKKKRLSTLTLEVKVSTSVTKEVNVAMIDTDIYCITCKLKRAQVFAIFIKNLKYQAEKKARPETDPKNVIPEKYHDFLDVFSKKNSDISPSHQNYNHKIILEEE